MADVRFSNAASAYQDALRAAERIISKVESGDTGETEGSGATSGASFLDMIGDALHGAEKAGFKSEAVSSSALIGKSSIADVVTAVASAENALSTVVAVRDKVISAYQDIIRMPI
jgi:flagellar hook-basal body complex protein FliE